LCAGYRLCRTVLPATPLHRVFSATIRAARTHLATALLGCPHYLSLPCYLHCLFAFTSPGVPITPPAAPARLGHRRLYLLPSFHRAPWTTFIGPLESPFLALPPAAFHAFHVLPLFASFLTWFSHLALPPPLALSRTTMRTVARMRAMPHTVLALPRFSAIPPLCHFLLFCYVDLCVGSAHHRRLHRPAHTHHTTEVTAVLPATTHASFTTTTLQGLYCLVLPACTATACHLTEATSAFPAARTTGRPPLPHLLPTYGLHAATCHAAHTCTPHLPHCSTWAYYHLHEAPGLLTTTTHCLLPPAWDHWDTHLPTGTALAPACHTAGCPTYFCHTCLLGSTNSHTLLCCFTALPAPPTITCHLPPATAHYGGRTPLPTTTAVPAAKPVDYLPTIPTYSLCLCPTCRDPGYPAATHRSTTPPPLHTPRPPLPHLPAPLPGGPPTTYCYSPPPHLPACSPGTNNGYGCASCKPACMTTPG